jgi:hypothetical protein
MSQLVQLAIRPGGERNRIVPLTTRTTEVAAMIRGETERDEMLARLAKVEHELEGLM